MKKVIIFALSGFFILLFTSDILAQTVVIDGVFRPRFEYRHGYQNIFPENATPANFISQRSRLGFKFSNDKFKVGFSLQNVGVWGETGTLSKSDINGTAVHEAWGEILFNERFSIKAGRQEIIYDDHRIFGSVDWAQQGRSHDAVIFKGSPNESNTIHLGIAYNALGESLEKLDYMRNNYKTFQYVHYHGQFGGVGVSVLALNNGMPYQSFDSTSINNIITYHFSEKLTFSRTAGSRFSYKNDLINTNAAVYYQFGNRRVLGGSQLPGGDTIMDIGAIYFSADIAFNVAKMFSFGAGFEYLSGNDEKKIFESDEGQTIDNAFAPLYGTNHKFNGWMDYFYVGNHFGSVGLIDVYIPIKFKKNKISAAIIPHLFQSAGTIYRQERDQDWDLVFEDDGYTPVMKECNRLLGGEIDVTVGYAFSKAVEAKAGYSWMLAAESMEYLKGRQANTFNSWGWVMLVFKPTFYNSENHK